MRFSASAIEIISRQYVNSRFIGVPRNRPVEDRTFRSYFKLSTIGVARLWYALEQTCSGMHYQGEYGPKVYFDNTGPQHLLLALHFMKTYCGAAQGANLFNMTEKTHRMYFWAMVCFLCRLGNCTVSITQKCIFFNNFFLTHYFYTDSTTEPLYELKRFRMLVNC